MKLKLGSIAFIALAVGVSLFILVNRRPPQDTRQPLQNSGDELEGTGNAAPSRFNAFLPDLPNKIPESPSFISPPKGKSVDLEAAGQEPKSPTVLEELNRIEELIARESDPVPEASEVIKLPEVPQGELTIDPNGHENLSDFLEYFAAHSATDITFAYEKFKTALKDENGLPLLPADLVQKALEEKNFAQVHDSLGLMKEFLLAKMDFLKSIKVTDEAIAVNQTMIGLDKLTLNLIQKAFDAEEKRVSAEELGEFLKHYNDTGLFHNAEFRKRSAISYSSGSESFLEKTADLFGLRKIANAIGFGFGGRIVFQIVCPCSGFGMSVTVGPPRPTKFYISLAQIASPLLYSYKAIHVAAYILGTYVPGSPPCLMFIGVGCAPIDVPVTTFVKAGTSI